MSTTIFAGMSRGEALDLQLAGHEVHDAALELHAHG